MNSHAQSSGTIITLITAILGMGWLTTIAAWLRERSKHKEELRGYMGKMRQKYYEQPVLLNIAQTLRAERRSSRPHPFVTDLDPSEMRKSPAFLEPIGIHLLANPKTPDEAYRVFGEEVLLCHRSDVLWKRDDYKGDCTYWGDFKKFALETDKRLGRELFHD